MSYDASIETILRQRIERPEIDAWVRRAKDEADELHRRFRALLERAWTHAASGDPPEVDEARRITQRIGYAIARLRYYWFEEPDAYANEESSFLARLDSELHRAFDRWLSHRVPVEPTDDVEGLLATWFERDRRPTLTEGGRYVAEVMGLAGYRRLLEIMSLNGLVESSHLSRVLGGASDPIQSVLTRIFIEEYGGGKLHRKHATFFARMLEDVGLSSHPEAYVDRVPWEVLASINHGVHLTEHKRLFLRFCGAFTYTEASTPVSFRAYADASRRLGLGDGENDYWGVHIREDERHGRWMLEEVAAPLARRFTRHRHELVRGYAEQRFLETRAAEAIVRECRLADAGGAA